MMTLYNHMDGRGMAGTRLTMRRTNSPVIMCFTGWWSTRYASKCDASISGIRFNRDNVTESK